MATALPTRDEILEIARDEVAAFASVADSIALEYHALANALEQRLGGDDLTWCGFAKWTAQAVGESLRLEPGARFWTDLRSAFRVPPWLASFFRRAMLRLLGTTYDRALSFANRAIFLEMGTFFADYLSPVELRTVHRLKARLDELPQFASNLVQEADESLLMRAANLYSTADASSPTPETKSRRVLGANIALSAFEQKRAQGALELVLYRPVRWVLVAWWRWPLSTRSKPNRDPRYVYYTKPHNEIGRLIQRLETAWARVYTRRVFAIATPVGKVYVGRTLSLPKEGSPLLRDTAPEEYEEEVRELVERFHPDPAHRLDGADNWLDYDARMRFIVSYFMLYQQVPQMQTVPPGLKPTSTWKKLHGVKDSARVRRGRSGIPVPPAVDPRFACTLVPVDAAPIAFGTEESGTQEPID